MDKRAASLRSGDGNKPAPADGNNSAPAPRRFTICGQVTAVDPVGRRLWMGQQEFHYAAWIRMGEIKPGTALIMVGYHDATGLVHVEQLRIDSEFKRAAATP